MLINQNQKIKACVRLSADYQIQFIKSHSVNLDDVAEDILEMLINWNWADIEGKKFFLTPFVLVFLILFLAVSLLLSNVLKVLDYFSKIGEIKAVRKKLNADNFDNFTSLGSLWFHYGVHKPHPEEDRVKVFQQWLEILYPKAICDCINLQKRMDSIGMSNAQLQVRARQVEMFFSFKDVLESVVQNISDEYPLITGEQ